jgi:hypothetical protein
MNPVLHVQSARGYAGKPAALGLVNLCLLGIIFALFTGCAGSPKTNSGVNKNGSAGQAPEWVHDTGVVYPDGLFYTAVGFSTSPEGAEKSALGKLVSVFGQSVEGEIRFSDRYSEVVTGRLLDTQEATVLENAVKTSFRQDTLIGAEIRDTWFDGVSTYYAVAVMDILTCDSLYRELITSNEEIIRTFLNIPEESRNSLDAYARYELAATIAEANMSFVNILSVLNPSAASLLRNRIRRPEELRLEGQDILRAIPVAVSVKVSGAEPASAILRDGGSRIGSAFAAVLSGAGFRTGGSGGRYRLDVNFSLEPVDLPQNPNKFIRYTLDARLLDTVDNQVLFPYTISGREGHQTVSEAEMRVLRSAENKITETYDAAFRDYLRGSAWR